MCPRSVVRRGEKNKDDVEKGDGKREIFQPV